MVPGDLAKTVAFFDEVRGDFVRFFAVVVARTPGYETRIKGGADHERDVLSPRRREHLIQGILMVDQRVLRSKEAYVWISDLKQAQYRFRGIHSKSPTFDPAFFTHTGQLREGALACDLKLLRPRGRKQFVIGGNIVDENDVQAVQTKTLQAIFNRTPYTGSCVVEGNVVWRWRERKNVPLVVL